jgi:hypothetical protein
MLTKLYSVNMKARDSVGDLGLDVRVILRWMLNTWDMSVPIGFLLLGVGTSGGHL